MLITSSSMRGPVCPLCSAPGKTCAHASTDHVTPVDNPFLLAANTPGGDMPELKYYTVKRPEYGNAETRMRLSAGDVKKLEVLGATVTAVGSDAAASKQAPAPANKARAASADK